MKVNGGIRHPRGRLLFILALSLWVAITIILAVLPQSVTYYAPEPVLRHAYAYDTGVFVGPVQEFQEDDHVADAGEMVVENYTPSENEVLHAISFCESGHRQFNADGTVLRNGSGSSAVGRWQIMESWWGESASALGYDMYTEDGNKAMARYILDTMGIRAWEASRTCLEAQGITM